MAPAPEAETAEQAEERRQQYEAQQKAYQQEEERRAGRTLADKIGQVLDAKAKPIKFPNYQGVPGTKTAPSLAQSGSLGSTSAHPVLEDFVAPSFLESLGLQFKILVLRRDPRICADAKRGYEGKSRSSSR